MDVKLLKSDILSNNIPKFMIFNNRENALCKQYVDNIIQVTNKVKKYFTNIEDFYKYIDTCDNTNNYYFILDIDINSVKLEYIEQLISTNFRIIIISEVDNNIKDKLNRYIFDFDKLDRNTIYAYLLKQCKQHKTELDEDKLFHLIDLCNNDLSLCLNEIDKIFIMDQENSNGLFDYMLKYGFSDYRQSNVFEFINKVLSKNINVFDDYLKLDDSPIQVFYNMYNMARKRFINSNNLYYCKVMELSYKLIKMITNGLIDADYSIKYFLYEVLINEDSDICRQSLLSV